MVLIRGTYRFALNADGSCCAFVLIDANTFANALFPPTVSGTDTTTIVGAAETSGEIRTRDISTFLSQNAYLYIGNPNPTSTAVELISCKKPGSFWRKVLFSQRIA